MAYSISINHLNDIFDRCNVHHYNRRQNIIPKKYLLSATNQPNKSVRVGVLSSLSAMTGLPLQSHLNLKFPALFMAYSRRENGKQTNCFRLA